MFKQNCVLSYSKIDAIVLITMLAKYHIFLCQLNTWPVSILQIVKNIKRERDYHLMCTSPENMQYYYKFWGVSFSDSIFEEEIAELSLLS